MIPSNCLWLVIRFVNHTQYSLDTLLYYNNELLMHALNRLLSAPRTQQFPCLNYSFQEIQHRQLLTDVVVTSIALRQMLLCNIRCYLPLIDTLPYIVSLQISIRFPCSLSLISASSLSYYILRFFRIFGNDSYVWIILAPRICYSSRSRATRHFSLSFLIFLSSIISVFIHHSALFHFRRQFCKFCEILSLRRL